MSVLPEAAMPTNATPGRPPIDRAAFEHILQAARALASSSDLHEVLALVIDALRDALHADRASVFQYDADAHELYASEAHGLPAALRIPADAGIVGQCASEKVTINIPDAYADARFNQEIDKQTGYVTRCLLTIPLLDPEENLVGVAQVLNKRGDGPAGFDEQDEVVASHIGDQAAVALKRAALLKAELKKEKLEADLQIARKIQLAALPAELPTFEGYEIVTRFEPADETGGDAFDVVDLRPFQQAAEGSPAEGSHADALMFLGDATGHGVGPALSVVQVLAMIRMACRLNAHVESIADKVNKQLCETLPVGRFVTAFLARLNTTDHVLHWTSAGQAPLLFLRASGPGDPKVEVRRANGLPMGIDPGFLPELAEPFVFEPGDVVAILSDGYYEAADPDGAMYGTERVVESIRGNLARPASEILERLRADLDAFTRGEPPDDDRTAVVVKRC
jgi:sigma-B regulation protein RsbU (phosphoserine phosphatase)